MNLVKANVPAAAAMKPLYCCDLRSGVKGENVTYEFDDSATLSGKVRKVGYYLQLTGNNGKESWVFVSMDAFSPDAKKRRSCLQFRRGLPDDREESGSRQQCSGNQDREV